KQDPRRRTIRDLEFASVCSGIFRIALAGPAAGARRERQKRWPRPARRSGLGACRRDVSHSILMNKQNVALFGTAFALMEGGALALNHFHTHNKLGTPAVKTHPLAGTQNLEVLLPENVLDYKSAALETSEVETN